MIVLFLATAFACYMSMLPANIEKLGPEYKLTGKIEFSGEFLSPSDPST